MFKKLKGEYDSYLPSGTELAQWLIVTPATFLIESFVSPEINEISIYSHFGLWLLTLIVCVLFNRLSWDSVVKPQLKKNMRKKNSIKQRLKRDNGLYLPSTLEIVYFFLVIALTILSMPKNLLIELQPIMKESILSYLIGPFILMLFFSINRIVLARWDKDHDEYQRSVIKEQQELKNSDSC